MSSALRFRLASASVVLCSALAGLTGCQHSTSIDPPRTTALVGTVHGGQQPVSGATIELLAVNVPVPSGAVTTLATTTTTQYGNFTLPSYTCPSPDASTLLIASGGNPGLAGTVDNQALELMAVLGPCGDLTSSVNIDVNELTTVAAVGVLYPYMSGSYVGGITQTVATTAFAQVQEYVNYATGSLPGTTLPAGYYASQADITTIADIIAPCVNSTGQDSNCANLFALLGSPAPTDIFSALRVLFSNPTSNTTALYDLISPTAPYEPTLASAPSTFALSITPLPATPTISPDGGTFSSDPSVTIADTTSGVNIYYTTDGTTPTAASTLYSSSFTITASETVQAVAIAANGAGSAVASASFTVP